MKRPVQLIQNSIAASYIRIQCTNSALMCSGDVAHLDIGRLNQRSQHCPNTYANSGLVLIARSGVGALFLRYPVFKIGECIGTAHVYTRTTFFPQLDLSHNLR